jgi:hypothetical protein
MSRHRQTEIIDVGMPAMARCFQLFRSGDGDRVKSADSYDV